MAEDKSLMPDWGCILRSILRGWWALLLAAAVAASAVYIAASELYTPKYEASATYVVSARGSATTVYSDLSAASELASAFTELMNSSVLKEKVAEETGVWDESASVEATLVPDTNLIDLKVTANSPRRAFLIIRSLIENNHIVTSKVMGNTVLQVLRAPKMPSAPKNANNARALALKAAWIAALAAAVIIGVFEHLSETVKNSPEAKSKIDTRLLVSVYHEKRRSKNKTCPLIITQTGVGFRFAETFKNLRTGVEHGMKEAGTNTVLVAGFADGEGKTTTAVNLALAFARKSKKVLLIDGDTISPGIEDILECSPPKDMRLRGFALGGRYSAKPLFSEKYGMYILAGKPLRYGVDFLLSGDMKKMMSALKAQMDYIIIDSPALSRGAEAGCLCTHAPVCVMAVRQDLSKAGDINDAIDTITQSGSKVLGCVLGDVRTLPLFGLDGSGYGYGYGHGYGYGYGYGHGYGYGYGYGKYGRAAEEEGGINGERQ